MRPEAPLRASCAGSHCVSSGPVGCCCCLPTKPGSAELMAGGDWESVCYEHAPLGTRADDGIGRARPARSCPPTCQPLCRPAVPLSGFPNMRACDWACCSEARRTPRDGSRCTSGAAPCWSADPGRVLLGRPLSGRRACGWLLDSSVQATAVRRWSDRTALGSCSAYPMPDFRAYDRNGCLEPGVRMRWGFRLPAHPKFAHSRVGSGKNGVTSYTSPARPFGHRIRARRPIMPDPERESLSSEVPSLPFGSRPAPSAARSGPGDPNRHRWSLSSLVNLVPPFRALANQPKLPMTGL